MDILGIKTFLLALLLTSALRAGAQTVTDHDGNVYPVITIGRQHWMGMNLRATHFNGGSPITDAGLANWFYFPFDEPRYTWPYVPPGFTKDTLALGLLYNYPAAGDPRNICPEGWHVPNDAEWSELIRFLDPLSDTTTTLESAIAGGMLKDTVLWISPNTGATNSTSFSALPVGEIPASITPPAAYFCCSGGNTSWWCGGPGWSPGVICHYRYLSTYQAGITRNTDNFSNGKSIRCVCDTLATTSIQESGDSRNITLYPNPAQDRIRLAVENGSLGPISVYDAVGSLVHRTFTSETSYELDVSDLAGGVYHVELSRHAVRLKFIKAD